MTCLTARTLSVTFVPGTFNEKENMEEYEGMRDIGLKECNANNSLNFERFDLRVCKSLWTMREFQDIPLKIYT